MQHGVADTELLVPNAIHSLLLWCTAALRVRTLDRRSSNITVQPMFTARRVISFSTASFRRCGRAYDPLPPAASNSWDGGVCVYILYVVASVVICLAYLVIAP